MTASVDPQTVELRPAPAEVESLPIQKLDQAPEYLLDTLPYGVIVLSRSGVVLRYNAAEARLARLDASTVLGKPFFARVAPCTRTEAFEGRFRRYVAEGRTDVERFSYVFDFTFGAQDVEIELSVGSRPGTFVLCVNRSAFRARRPEVDPSILAPRQEDLRPAEASLGIRRDDDAQRQILVDASLFRALHASWARIAPRGWPLFTAEWGRQWGRQLTVDLEVASLQAHEAALTERPLGDVLDTFTSRFREQGWGAVAFDLGDLADAGFVVIEVEGSAVAEVVGRVAEPRCHLFCGVFEALFSHLAGRLVHVRELTCASQGAERCRFVLIDRQRKAELESLVLRVGSDAQVVRDAWCGS